MKSQQINTDLYNNVIGILAVIFILGIIYYIQRYLDKETMKDFITPTDSE